MSNEITKTSAMIKEELKSNIIKSINECTLPAFVIEYILKDILNELHIISDNQLRNDLNEYNQKLKELEKELEPEASGETPA